MADRPSKVAPSVRVLVVTVAVAVIAGACGGKTPATRTSGVITLAPGPAARYRTVTASGPGGTSELTGDLRDAAVPLLAARAFSHPQPLVEYGLDQPQGQLRYQPERGAPIEVSIGGPTFDARGVYVARPGDGRVFLVFVDRLRPVLSAMGIELPVQIDREPAAA